MTTLGARRRAGPGRCLRKTPLGNGRARPPVSSLAGSGKRPGGEAGIQKTEPSLGLFVYVDGVRGRAVFFCDTKKSLETVVGV